MEAIINSIIVALSGQGIISIFFKLFAVVLSILYVLYAIVLYRQIGIMNKTVQTQAAPILQVIGLIQVFASAALLFLAILFI